MMPELYFNLAYHGVISVPVSKVYFLNWIIPFIKRMISASFDNT